MQRIVYLIYSIKDKSLIKDKTQSKSSYTCFYHHLLCHHFTLVYKIFAGLRY